MPETLSRWRHFNYTRYPSLAENALGATPSKTGVSPPAEWLVLLECARPNQSPGHLPVLLQRNSPNWPALLELADEHGLLPLLIAWLPDSGEDLVPAGIRHKLRERARAQTVFTLQLTGELFLLLARFAASGITTLVTKGPVLAQRCYGDPGMRQYGDLDLIVFENDIRRVTEAMIGFGYEPRIPVQAIAAKKVPGEYVFRRPGPNLLIEFHTERTFRYRPRRLRLESLFERQARVEVDGQGVPALSVEDELVLICIHGAKHFWERLMWVADVAALISRNPGIDWDRVTSAAREVGAERMLCVGLQLASTMLGVGLPREIDQQVFSDVTALRLAAQIAKRMAEADSLRLGILERATFRMKMRGGLLPGAAYLLRLLFSPTEEDWIAGSEEKRDRKSVV